jgi:hypothetical protein
MNKKVGIVCDLSFKYHIMQENYYQIINGLFNDVKIVKSEKDLKNIEILFICDEFFQSNKEIWMTDIFINTCNSIGLKVVILNSEKIFNSWFSWNEEIHRNVEKFQNRLELVYDPVDSKILNADINKTYISKKVTIQEREMEKKNKILFVGQLSGVLYVTRNRIISELVSKIPNDIDVFLPNPNRTIHEYFDLLNSYKYILSPIGNHDGVPFRFYESLYVKSIPIQQYVNDNILNSFSDDKTILFKNVDEILNFREIETKQKDYCAEDFYYNILKKHNVI